MKDLSHVRRIDFIKDYGTWTEDMVAIFNEDRISEEEVVKFIKSDEPYHPHIIIMYLKQFNNVFNKVVEGDN